MKPLNLKINSKYILWLLKLNCNIPHISFSTLQSGLQESLSRSRFVSQSNSAQGGTQTTQTGDQQSQNSIIPTIQNNQDNDTGTQNPTPDSTPPVITTTSPQIPTPGSEGHIIPGVQAGSPSPTVLTTTEEDENHSNSESEDEDVTEFVTNYTTKENLVPIVGISKLQISDIFLNSKFLQSHFESVFTRIFTNNDKLLYLKDDFSFLKSKSSSELLVSSKYIFQVWVVWYHFYSKFLKAHLIFFNNLKPISFYYIKYLDLVIRQNDSISTDNTSQGVSINNLLFSNLLPRIPNFVGLSVYGLSMLSSDLLLFTPPPFRKMEFRSFISADLKPSFVQVSLLSPNNSIVVPAQYSIYNKSYKYSNKDSVTKEFLPNFDINQISKIKDFHNNFGFDKNRSSFYKDSFNLLFDELYEIDPNTLNITINYSVESTSTRVATTSRDDSGKFSSHLGGFTTHNIVLNNVSFCKSDHYIGQFLVALLYLPSLNLSDDRCNDIIRYVTTVIASYFLSQVVNNQNYTLLDFKFECDLTYKKPISFKDLRHKYVSYVQKGLIMPLSPLHYAFYLNSDFDFVAWFRVIVYSSFIMSNLSQSIKTVSPFIDLESKYNFYDYCNNRDMLKSSYYGSRFTVSSVYNHVELSFDDFILELAVRNFLLNKFDLPVPLITLEKWNGLSSSSIKISSPHLNSYFLKYRMVSDNLANEYLNKLAIIDTSDKPAYVKGSVRCVEKLPNVFSRFLELLDEEDSIDDSFYDSSVIDESKTTDSRK